MTSEPIPSKPADSGRVTEDMIQAAIVASESYSSATRIGWEAMRSAISAALATQGQREPIAWTTGIEWKPRESEVVRKLTRKSQPAYGFDTPLYTHPGHPQCP
jgi:hypothetical protein